jgi:hypothetical protein
MAKPEYVNGFAFTVNDVTGETTITMFTNHFEFDEENQAIDTRDITGKFIMSYDSAQVLQQCLTDALNKFQKK